MTLKVQISHDAEEFAVKMARLQTDGSRETVTWLGSVRGPGRDPHQLYAIDVNASWARNQKDFLRLCTIREMYLLLPENSKGIAIVEIYLAGKDLMKYRVFPN